MNKKPLEGTKCYLSGAIEHDGESVVNWRIEPKEVLNDRFKIDVFDPFDDPKQQWVPSLDKARKEKDHKTISKIARDFVRKDLDVVDKSDFIIAYLPYKMPTTGTHHEIINSNDSKKPTLLITNDDIAYLPLWYFGFIPLEFMFSSWDCLYDYLDSVNNNDEGLHDRWDLVCGRI